jgi:hypothetical protein
LGKVLAKTGREEGADLGRHWDWVSLLDGELEGNLDEDLDNDLIECFNGKRRSGCKATTSS